MDAIELLKRYADGERDFHRANLKGIVLTVVSSRSTDISENQLDQQNRPYLIGANLSEADLSNAHLSRANLSKADFCHANLSGANLSGASLSGANLSGANLNGANLHEVNLVNANLHGALVEGAKFGKNSGIPEEVKHHLIEKGAIFEE